MINESISNHLPLKIFFWNYISLFCMWEFICQRTICQSSLTLSLKTYNVAKAGLVLMEIHLALSPSHAHSHLPSSLPSVWIPEVICLLAGTFTPWDTASWLWKPDPAHAGGEENWPRSRLLALGLTLVIPCLLPAYLAVWLLSFASISARISSVGKLRPRQVLHLEGNRAVHLCACSLPPRYVYFRR